MKCRYIGPYQILERIGPVAYRLALSPNLSEVHDVFHVSQLRKGVADPDAIVETHQPEVQPHLTVAEHPAKILDHAKKALRNKVIPYVKVLWSGQIEREVTWETEESMRRKYPKLFS